VTQIIRAADDAVAIAARMKELAAERDAERERIAKLYAEDEAKRKKEEGK
jgi:hypothetical protein